MRVEKDARVLIFIGSEYLTPGKIWTQTIYMEYHFTIEWH